MNTGELRKEEVLVEEWSVDVKMEKKTFWIIAGIAIVVLLAFVVWQTVKINSLSSATNIAKSAASATKAAASSSGMVGGC